MPLTPLVTVPEASRRLRVSQSTIRHWLRRGVLKGVKVGKLHRIPRNEVDRVAREGSSIIRLVWASVKLFQSLKPHFRRHHPPPPLFMIGILAPSSTDVKRNRQKLHRRCSQGLQAVEMSHEVKRVLREYLERDAKAAMLRSLACSSKLLTASVSLIGVIQDLTL